MDIARENNITKKLTSTVSSQVERELECFVFYNSVLISSNPNEVSVILLVLIK